MLIIKKKKKARKSGCLCCLGEILNFASSPLLRARRKRRLAKVADDRFDDEELISRLARLSQRHAYKSRCTVHTSSVRV